MKRGYLYLAAAVVLAGCTDVLEEKVSVVSNGLKSPETFTAVIDGAPVTKTYLGSTAGKGEAARTRVNWDEGDEIAVYSAACKEGVKYVIDNIDIEDPTQAVFKLAEGQENGLGDGPYYAVYPYSATSEFSEEGLKVSTSPTQVYANANISSGAGLAVAKSSETKFKFYNLCGIVKLSFTGAETEKVKSVTLSSPDNSGAVATASVTFAEDGSVGKLETEFTENSTVTLSVPEAVSLGSQAKDFYVVVPEGSFKNGMTVTVRNMDEKCFSCSASSAEVQRSVILDMPAVNCDRFMLQGTVKASVDGSTLLAPGEKSKINVSLEPEGLDPALKYTVIPDGAATIAEDGTVTLSSNASGPVTINVSADDLALPGTMEQAVSSVNIYAGPQPYKAEVPEYSGERIHIEAASEYAAAEDVVFYVDNQKYEGTVDDIIESVNEESSVECRVEMTIGGVKYFKDFSVGGMKPYIMEFSDWESVPGVESGDILNFRKSAIAFSPDGNHAYMVSDYVLSKNKCYLVSIDLENRRPEWAINLNVKTNMEVYAVAVNPVTGLIYAANGREHLYAYDASGNLVFDASSTDGRKCMPSSREHALALSSDGKWLYVGDNDNGGVKTLNGNTLVVLDAATGAEMAWCKDDDGKLVSTTSYQLVVKDLSATEKLVVSASRAGTYPVAVFRHVISSEGVHSISLDTNFKSNGVSIVKEKWQWPLAVAPDGTLYNLVNAAAATDKKNRVQFYDLESKTYLGEYKSGIPAGQMWSVCIGPNAAAENGGAEGAYRVYLSSVFNGQGAAVEALPPRGKSGNLVEFAGNNFEGYDNKALQFTAISVSERGSVYTPLLLASNALGPASMYEFRTDRNWGWSSAKPEYNDVARVAESKGADEYFCGCTGHCGHYVVTGYSSNYTSCTASGVVRVRLVKYPRAKGYWSGPSGDPCMSGNVNLVYGAAAEN